MKHFFLAALLTLGPAAASASTVFEATPTDAGGAFDISFPAGSSLGPDPQSQFVGSIFGGAGFAISGPENFSGRLASGGLMESLQFQFYQPTKPDKLEGCNTACVNSSFTLELLLGGANVATINLMAELDTLQVFIFPGFGPFDEFIVTEVSGGNDNEFFANFQATTVAPVPLPAGGLLLIGALGALGLLRRQKS